MAHSDTVNVDPKKWIHPPFGAVRDGGYVYGRGTVDDKDNVVASVMTMLMLKRMNVKLDRDVILLIEAGEEGTSRLGIQFMANEHFPEIDAEFCYAEGGGLTRTGGEVKFARVQTVEKIPRAITVTSKGVAGHGSVPLETNALAHLGEAVGAIAAWTPPMRINETTAAYFKRLATVSTPEEAARYRDILNPDPKISGPADAYLRKNEPSHWSMLRTSLSPTMITGGYRTNVIPSEGTATIDTRLAPDEDPAKFLELVKQVVNDPQVDVSYGARDTRPPTPTAKLDSDAFKAIEANITKHYKTRDPADHEHRRDRHGVSPPEGRAVLRHWPGPRQRGPDGQWLAYAVAEGGADWERVRVRSVATHEDLADEVAWVRFSELAWTHDSQGFFYSRYPEPPKQKVLEAALSGQAVSSIASARGNQTIS